MSRLVIEGVRYDLQEALQKASIRSLVDLKKAAGISVIDVVETLGRIGDMESPTDIFDSEESLTVFAAMVFLCRRKAGEKLTFDDAAEVSMADVVYEVDDDEAADDPKDQSTPAEPGEEDSQPA